MRSHVCESCRHDGWSNEGTVAAVLSASPIEAGRRHIGMEKVETSLVFQLDIQIYKVLYFMRENLQSLTMKS